MKTFPPGKLFDATFSRSHYFATVPNDVSLEDVMTPGFWRDHAGSMKVGTIIEVMRADGTLDLTARVIASGPGMVKLRQLFPPHNDEKNLRMLRREAAKGSDDAKAAIADDGGLEAPTGYKIKHSPATGYFVLLTVGGGEVQNITQGQKGLSKLEATKFAIEHHRQATTPLNA